ncbi:transport integral membrane protein [Rhizocola hellebori]|uniref:Transport integral membrane protein n=1 Tax=Rhizocola hellebori TaxID=1392758 RepID=A0A8J3VI55_9ACTN|nr:copper resistance protein CopC [Rhizocola hellebori]GIH06987.1 transport integral membrane protein [Rhizocola hellebori]
MIKRVGFIVLSGLLLVLGVASPAQAHAVLTKSNPVANSVVQEAPKQVVLTFSESITPVNEKIRVIGPDGKRADNGKITVEGGVLRIGMADNPARGTYLVSYRVISADSHPVPGGFTYSYGQQSATPAELPQQEVENTAVSNLIKFNKYLGYLGLVLLVGAAWVLALLWPARLERRPAKRVLWIGFGIVGLTTVAGLYLQIPYTSGNALFSVDGTAVSDVMESRYGVAMLVRLAVLAVAAILLRPMLNGTSGKTDRALALILAVLGALTYSAAGHPAASPVPAVSMAADALHLGGAAFWLGGLVMLALFLLRQADEREAEAILPVWSRWAGFAVSVVLLSGVMAALIEVGTVSALLETTYGRWLVVKLGLVSLLLLTAWFSRKLVPRLETGKLRRLVIVELVIAAMVLGVTAVLTQTTPARTAEVSSQTPTQPGYFTATLDSSLYQLQVEIDPARVGNNLVHLFAYGPDGKPVLVVEWKVTAALPAAGVEPIEVPTLKLTDNHATGSITLPTAGAWEFRFTLRLTEFDQDTVAVTVQVK